MKTEKRRPDWANQRLGWMIGPVFTREVVMRITFPAILLTMAIFASTVRADPADLLGEWYQVASNAGDCADCRVSINRSDAGFAVVANNGWSARLQQGPDERIALVGHGQWEIGAGGSYSGAAFHIGFHRLVMVMTVPYQAAG